MAIPLEAAPATVLPKSNLAQLGYQLGQQQQAQELAEADRFNKQLEAIGNVGFWAEMDSPIMGQMTNMFLETAAEAAADPTNRELAIRLAREKAQIQRYARKSEYDQKVHIANEQFARQNPDFAGKDAWAQSLIGRGQGEVVRDDDGTFRINGEMVENAFPSVSMIGKKPSEVSWNKELVQGVSLQPDYINNKATYSSEGVVNRARGIVTARYDGAEPSDRRKMLESFIIRDWQNQAKTQDRVPSRDWINSQLANPDVVALMETAMLDQAANAVLDQYGEGKPLYKPEKGGDDPDSSYKSVVRIGQVKSLPITDGGEAQNVWGISVNTFDYIPKGKEKGTLMEVNEVYVDPNNSNVVYLRGQSLTSREREILKKYSGGESLDDGEQEDLDFILQKKSKPETIKVTGTEISSALSPLAYGEKGFQGITDPKKFMGKILEVSGFRLDEDGLPIIK